MSNLRIEPLKLQNREFRCVYDIIINQYLNGKLTTFNTDHIMFAYFFQRGNISKTKRLYQDILILEELILQFQFQHMLKSLL